MKIFADFHHQGLFNSLSLLFEKRLGYELYRPIGEEWYNEGYWMVYNHPQTVRQYLGLHNGTNAGVFQHTSPLNAYHQYSLFNQQFHIENDIYYITDTVCNAIHKGIQLKTFKDMEFDIILSSIPEHVGRYNQLIQKFQPKAKHIFQVGNNWDNQPGVQNIMASTRPFQCNQNIVFYHQEFDLNVFEYHKPVLNNTVNSYVHFMKKQKLFKNFLQQTGWTGNTYGGGCDDALTTKGVAVSMKDSSLIWHYKPGGDGYGHVIHSTFACGRPPIIWGSQYKNCLAEQLFDHMSTCIDAEKIGDLQQLAKTVTGISEEQHATMCENAYYKFRSIVDFDTEEQQIRKFIEDLI